MRPRGGLSWLDPGAFGTLGVGGGFALGTFVLSLSLTEHIQHSSSHSGAALCRPKSDVWLIWGDGSAGYSIAEFDTFVRGRWLLLLLLFVVESHTHTHNYTGTSRSARCCRDRKRCMLDSDSTRAATDARG